ncbi:MAG: discoidin domain-containing protein [Planctomycetaceae bacterium]|nr:discoidin domain-containing protein [Planctomycetaceae bacterium]
MNGVSDNLLNVRSWIGALILLNGALSAQAGIVLAPSSVVANNMGNTTQLDRAYNQVHLSHTYTSGATDFDAFLAQGVTHNSVPGSSRWQSSNNITTGAIDFDLGGAYRIDRIVMWDGGFLNLEDVNSLTILISDVSNFATSSTLGTINLGNPGVLVLDTARTHQLFNLSSASGRYVRLQINSNQGALRSSLAEFAFDAVAIPEASSFAQVSLMMFICALLPALRSRRATHRDKLVQTS